MPDRQNQWLCLRSDDLTVEIDPLGAQLSTLRDRAGRDLLWNGVPSVWGGRAPLLFPIVGALAGGSYRLGTKIYHLPRHGFARGKLFHLWDSTSSSAVFRLTADETTLPVYPFRFELDVRFALFGPTLSVSATIRNVGDGVLPASFGYHPAFRWPLPFGGDRASHFIEFEHDEPAPIRRLNADGLLTAERHPTPVVHRRLVLADTLFQDDVMIFDAIRSRSISYGTENGPKIRLNYPDAPLLGIWGKPGANFVCIEPWHGVADVVGFTGDFREKMAVFTLSPQATLAANMSITLPVAGHL
ncbi:MAG: aldose 1-epimerase family protein [Pseudomonadota bacterium]|nr:aldose 1-epimerase family protein [Pseudomonadota bacterium]